MPDLQASLFYHFLNRGRDFSTGDLNRDFIDWNGHALPMHQGNAEIEYKAIRHSAALFDVSPIGKITIKGRGAGELLDHVMTRKVSNLENNRAAYVIMCNADGTVRDDAMI